MAFATLAINTYNFTEDEVRNATMTNLKDNTGPGIDVITKWYEFWFYYGDIEYKVADINVGEGQN